MQKEKEAQSLRIERLEGEVKRLRQESTGSETIMADEQVVQRGD